MVPAEMAPAKKQPLKGPRAIPEGDWNPPPETDRGDVTPVYPGDRRTSRIIVRTRYLDHRLIDFALIHEIYIDERWQQVTRVDTKNHGSVHQHFSTRTGGEDPHYLVLAPLHSADDVARNWDMAYDLVFNNINRHERRWHG